MIEFIIRRKTLISMLFIALSMLGYISYRNLPVELLPEVELPFLIVQIGAVREMDPAQLEKEALIPLESIVATQNGIEKIESSAERRQGRIMVFYRNNVDLKYAYLRLQEKIDAARGDLPEGYFVQVVRIDTDMISNMFMNLQVRGGGGVDRLRNLTENDILEELQAIDGIANAEVFGGKEKSVRIVLDRQKSEAFGITANDISSLLRRYGSDKQYLGYIRSNDKRISVNLLSDYRNVDDIGDLIVEPTIPLRLKDVADIEYGMKEETSISRVNGKEAVTIQLIRDSRVNLIELSDRTAIVIDRLNRELQNLDVEIVIQFDSAEYLRTNMDLIINLAVTGAMLAILILWFFLKNLRMVLVIAVSLPASVFTAFNFFYAFGITINSLTLVGMALAIGMLLDNSIVVLESIYRKIQGGAQNTEAVLQGTREVSRSIIAATLTTITVFLPFIFADNFFIKILGYHVGVSIISSLGVSLLVAVLLIPMIMHWMLGLRSGQSAQIEKLSVRTRLMQIYVLFLKSTVRYPIRTIVLSVVLFFVSLIIALGLSMDVSNEPDLEEFNLYVTMPRGSTLETTDLAVAEFEKGLEEIAELDEVISQVYEEEAVLTLKLKKEYHDIAGRSIAEVKGEINQRIEHFRAADVGFEQPESSTRFRGGGQESTGEGFRRFLGLGGSQEYIYIKGQDIEVMRRLATDMETYLRDLSFIERARVNLAPNRPEIHLLFDNENLFRNNITLNAIVSELNTFQKENTTGSRFKDGTEEYDIIIGDGQGEDKNVGDLRRLRIRSQSGSEFPLAEIAPFLYSEGRSAINRVNQERQVRVSFRFTDDVTDSRALLESARSEIDDMVAGLEIPAGIAVEVEHNDLDLSDFYFLTAVTLILIFMILASVFESILHPLVIMFTIPLAAIGSLWAIILTGKPLLNANTLIGFLILLGIVVNNGIILIDYVRQLQKKGNRRVRALIMAGQARLRPIFITAITTIIAMLPLAMGREEYVTQIAAPFAVTVIGGLALSTVFTLVLIPTVFAGLYGFLEWFRDLNPWLRYLQLALISAATILIYFQIESLIWQFADFFLVLAIVPLTTAFVLNSLRRARTDLFAENENLTIRIRNLYKLYDLPSRFVREWRKGERIAAGTDAGREAAVSRLVWQYIIFAYLVYFIYFYLESNFWFYILSFGFSFYLLFLLSEKSVDNRELVGLSGMNIPRRFSRILRIPVFWFFPALTSALLSLRTDSVTSAVLFGSLWYLGIWIYVSAKNVRERKIDVNRIGGKLSGLRRGWYRLVQAIPLIGKRRSPFAALKGVSLDIEKGMFGLLGPNGAGKTTLMRIICGVLEPSYGSVYISGINTREQREEVQGLIGYLPQEFGTYENMTASEFLNYQAILKGLTEKEQRRERIDYVLGAVHLEEHRHQKIGSFSGGMKQRIGIAQTLLHLPRILVVDEPTAGLDPRERIRFRNLLVELSRERIVLFSTHIIEDIASSCNMVAVLNSGEIKYIGDPKKMVSLADGKVWQCLLSEQEFESGKVPGTIVHHIQVDNHIRLRLLSEKQPVADARTVKPTLEDAYLWLLRNDNGGAG